MKIGIRLDRDDFMYDIHSLVKSFFQDDDVSVFTENNSDKCSEEWNLLFAPHSKVLHGFGVRGVGKRRREVHSYRSEAEDDVLAQLAFGGLDGISVGECRERQVGIVLRKVV